jgi:anti-anti-sigma factor
MDVTRTVTDAGLCLAVEGRVDGYWSDHLDEALVGAVREGHHRIVVDCEKVTFLSSAGIGVFVKHHRELTRISGSFQIVNPSAPVAAVLRMTRLSDVLIGAAKPVAATVAPRVSTRIEADGLTLDIYEIDARARLACRALGSPDPLATAAFGEADCRSLAGASPALAVGVGAFGDSFEDCRGRFGEMISVAGATACQPADGTNVPDYLVTRGPLGEVRLLYGLVGDGAFSHLVRFEVPARGVVTLSTLLGRCLDVTKSGAVGAVIVSETAGLVGAALRRSPVEPLASGDFFTHPSVRARLSFSAERTFTQSVTLVAGFAAREGIAGAEGQLRPLGGGIVGHVHAAAFRFQPVQKGFIELQDTASRLFDTSHLSGVVHLLNDDRGASGAGESEFIRGACWIAPIA